jgi:predicted small lipoprotein YifL
VGVCAVAVLVVAGLVAGCGLEGPSEEPPTTERVEPPTTVDPLAAPVVDACGNDLAALTSAVVGVDPQDGTVRWQAEVPLADTFLLRSADGDPQLSLVLRKVELVLDADTGDRVDTPPGGVHEVLVDPTGSTASGVGGLLVDGTPQPAIIEVDGRRLTTAAGETGQTTLSLTATDATTSAPAWTVALGPADQIAAVSAPVLYGDIVVVVTSPPRPDCPSPG